MDEFTDIIYPGSPFLPEITRENTLVVLQEILFRNRPPSVALSFELCTIAVDLNQYHSKDQIWLQETFKASLLDLDRFMFGYVIAPSLIIGSYLVDIWNIKEAIKRICPPGGDEFLMKVNAYKNSHLISCSDTYRALKYDFKKGGLAIYDHCKKNPFSDNRFYLAGINSSRIGFLDLYSKIELVH